jgi:hypothetical protein
MSTEFYNEIYNNVVVKQITRFGKAITLKQINQTSYNPVTGDYDDNTFTSYSGLGLQTDYNNTDIDGTIIKQGDKQLLAIELAVTPIPNDRIVVDGVEYNIENVSEVRPGSVLMFYRIQIRK